MGIGLDGVEMIRVEVHRADRVEVIELRPPVTGSIELEIGQRELPPESGWRVWEPDGTAAVRLKVAGQFTAQAEAAADRQDAVADLIIWLRQQFAPDEKIARAAAEQCGCHPPFPHWQFAGDEHDGRIMITDYPHGDGCPCCSRLGLCRRWNRSFTDMAAARHITTWDPQRAFAEIAAKRHLLQQFELRRRSVLGVDGCETGGVWDDLLRMLGLAYADRPGYRQEWRP
jgi:hypothetical protein